MVHILFIYSVSKTDKLYKPSSYMGTFFIGLEHLLKADSNFRNLFFWGGVQIGIRIGFNGSNSANFRIGFKLELQF